MSWDRIRGHEHVTRAFERAFQRGRLAHAYLFVGPKGIGKKRFAVELAKALLCETSAGRFNSCNRCSACIQVESGTHPDFQLVGLPEERHEFPIELMQEVIRRLSMKPARGRHRIAIIDDADDLNEESANCFLKTLEEPPPASLLILIGTTADRQLPTIVSRCQLIRFSTLPADFVAEQLVRDGVIEKPADARRVAEAAGGNLAEAAALGDTAFAKLRRDLAEGLTRQPVDSVGLAEAVNRFVEEAGKESAAKRQRAGLVLKFLIQFVRDAILLKQGGQSEPAKSDTATMSTRLAERLDEERLMQLLERCLEADYQIDRRLQLVLVLEALMDALGEGLQAAAK